MEGKKTTSLLTSEGTGSSVADPCTDLHAWYFFILHKETTIYKKNISLFLEKARGSSQRQRGLHKLFEGSGCQGLVVLHLD